MQKDFKNAKPVDSGYKMGMVWMLAGVFMGLLVGLSMYFYANRNAPLFASASTAIADKDPSELSREERILLANAQNTDALVGKETAEGVVPLPASLQEPAPKERAVFSFHAVLPSIDMPVSPRPVALTQAAMDAAAPQREAVSGDFIIQVASFRTPKQADQSRSKLHGRGVTSRVEEFSSKGKTWYRVLAGPIAEVQLQDWKTQIVGLGYDPLVRKVR
ncbi:SPOR domain-containing protein [Leucothrix mucor]|jgi:cell division protein FtsN|uniref:SPOR domain-containing protein n=1 Tax=Leucothrix mucor TaxID=45248 RepID=UPI0003B64C36|nr:SPOR domain-containing protein [Leucothrix mucor]